MQLCKRKACYYYIKEINSGVTGGGGQSAPRDFWLGNFCWLTGKREARKKGRMEQKRRKIKKGKVENWKWKEEKLLNEERTFFFFFFFFKFIYLFFSLFKTSEICFGSTKMGIFYQEKAFHAGKNIRKMIFPPPLLHMPLEINIYIYIQLCKQINTEGHSLMLSFYAFIKMGGQ